MPGSNACKRDMHAWRVPDIHKSRSIQQTCIRRNAFSLITLSGEHDYFHAPMTSFMISHMLLLQCVVCLAAKATMQTFPCGHKVVCRKCFIKTIQVAVTQRSLPLTCVVCRTKILKLKQSGEESASSSSKRHSGSGQGSSSRKLSGPAQLARQLLMGGGSHHHARHPPQTPPSSKNFHDGHPVVATKIMKPLLIYPSQTSPKQQHAFSTDGDRSSANHRPTSTPQRNTAARPSHSHYKDSPKRAQRPLVSCTDSPIMSGRGWADKHSCQHSHKLDSKYTHLLSPRVTSRCSHCAPNDKVAHNQVVKQGV